VRKAAGKLLSAKSIASPLHLTPQPHLEIAVQPLGVEKSKQIVTKGHVMVDTGAAVTMVTQAWATAHGLKVTPGKKINLRGAGGASIPTVGVSTFTLQLTPTLEVDLNVLVSEGNIYQGLIGSDVLMGKFEVLGPATIKMLSPGDQGHIQWKQDKLGCIAIASFLPPASSVHATKALPPLPPPSTNLPGTTLAAEGVTLDQATRESLAGMAAERDD
jgi:Aspartyl protease